MTTINGAGLTSMTVSVQVLVVDGTRRMSHKFYDQIPRRDVIDEDGEIVEGAELWGQVDLPDCPYGSVEVVWALDGRLYTAVHDTRQHATENLKPWGDAERDRLRTEWNATVDERNAATDQLNATVRQLRHELPQLLWAATITILRYQPLGPRPPMPRSPRSRPREIHPQHRRRPRSRRRRPPEEAP